MAIFKGKGSSKLHASPGAHVIRHAGKGAEQELLPNRHAMATLTGGSASDRNMNQYAKATPNIEQAAPPGQEAGAPPGGVGPNDYSLG